MSHTGTPRSEQLHVVLIDNAQPGPGLCVRTKPVQAIRKRRASLPVHGNAMRGNGVRGTTLLRRIRKALCLTEGRTLLAMTGEPGSHYRALRGVSRPRLRSGVRRRLWRAPSTQGFRQGRPLCAKPFRLLVSIVACARTMHPAAGIGQACGVRPPARPALGLSVGARQFFGRRRVPLGQHAVA